VERYDGIMNITHTKDTFTIEAPINKRRIDRLFFVFKREMEETYMKSKSGQADDFRHSKSDTFL
jgi:hypothetical protein